MNRNTSSSSSIGTINLSHNNFYGPIPEYISGFPNLFHIDLSHNGFIGAIPRSMSKLVSLSYLDLSYNKLEGQVPSFLWRLYSLKLSHNSFSSLEKSVGGSHFDLGSNSFPRLFPHWNCKFRSRPSCLMNSTTSLGYLNLRNNNISGLLPDIFTNATELETLDISHNRLVGKLPKSLISCKKMKFLNLKGNKIKDTFPSWLESMESLRVLLLGSNAFYGPIYSASGFPTLQVMDISHNNFNGTLPQDCFVNWLEMSSVDKIESYELPNGTFSLEIGSSVYMGNDVYGYEDSMDMIYKGVETEFSRIFRGYKAIDFSGNKFKGWIPTSTGLLKGLLLLNLSGNAFTGNIPSSLANITILEALDDIRSEVDSCLGRPACRRRSLVDPWSMVEWKKLAGRRRSQGFSMDG